MSSDTATARQPVLSEFLQTGPLRGDMGPWHIILWAPPVIRQPILSWSKAVFWSLLIALPSCRDHMTIGPLEATPPSPPAPPAPSPAPIPPCQSSLSPLPCPTLSRLKKHLQIHYGENQNIVTFITMQWMWSPVIPWHKPHHLRNYTWKKIERVVILQFTLLLYFFQRQSN